MYWMNAILRDVERTKIPETQLRNIRNKLGELESIQEQQQAKVSIEMGKGTKYQMHHHLPTTINLWFKKASITSQEIM